MAEEFVTGLIAASLRVGTPIIIAALGETIAERSGVMNLGVEGMMIMSAFTSFATIYLTGNNWLGLLVGLTTGALMASLHAYMTVSLKINQIVCGLVFTILGLALSTYLYLSYFGNRVTTIAGWAPTPVPILNQIPIIGPAIFQQNIITYMAIILTVILTIFLFRTSAGLTVRAVGEHPLAADTVGIKVKRARYLCTIFGGLMAGMAGTVLITVNITSFFSGMTTGRGWIAIAIVIFGRWTPSLVFAGGFLFGFLDSLQVRLQALSFPIPTQIILMTPYIFTLVALLLVARRSSGPAALGTPYEKGGR